MEVTSFESYNMKKKPNKEVWGDKQKVVSMKKEDG